MAALVDSDGNARPLDGKAPARATFTAEDAKDPEKVARLIAGLLDDVAELRRRYAPRWVDFEDVAVSSGGSTLTLEHGFGGRVRWWIVDCSSNVTVASKSTATTDDTLVLSMTTAADGTATIRVEAVDG